MFVRNVLLPGFAYHTSRLLRVLVLVQVVDHDIGALAREGNGHRTPDPATFNAGLPCVLPRTASLASRLGLSRM
jgi:hypothetical protein